MTDHMTLRLHTGGHYLTNYVTSEGNWLHQILFRGFIAKGVITYAKGMNINAKGMNINAKRVWRVVS